MLQANKSDESQLTLAQMHLKQGRTAEAALSLRNVETLQHAPATVATLVALYKSAGDDSSAVLITILEIVSLNFSLLSVVANIWRGSELPQ